MERLIDPKFPKSGDIVRINNNDYAIVIRHLNVTESRKYGFFGYVVSSHGKEFVVNENDVTLMDDKAIREIFIKEKIEP